MPGPLSLCKIFSNREKPDMMMENETLIEWNARVMRTVREIEPGVFEGDPYHYCYGVTASALRSGVDGPHSGLADRLCSINGRRYE